MIDLNKLLNGKNGNLTAKNNQYERSYQCIVNLNN